VASHGGEQGRDHGLSSRAEREAEIRSHVRERSLVHGLMRPMVDAVRAAWHHASGAAWREHIESIIAVAPASCS